MWRKRPPALPVTVRSYEFAEAGRLLADCSERAPKLNTYLGFKKACCITQTLRLSASSASFGRFGFRQRLQQRMR